MRLSRRIYCSAKHAITGYVHFSLCVCMWPLNSYLQLKAEYKIIQTLCGLSRFSWDEGEKTVTAPLEVWENYVQVFLLSFLLFLLTISCVQSHHKAKKFMHKPFPLYDDIVELCDAMIEMGAGAFRGTGGTGDVSVTHYVEGSEV